MISTPRANGLAAQSGPANQDAWWPPPSLLDAVSGDHDLIAEVIDAFHTDTGARMLQIRAALADSDFLRIRVEAHTIKGGARQVGADALADACQKLETISELKEASLVAAPLNRVQELFEKVHRGMASYSSSRSPDPSETVLR